MNLVVLIWVILISDLMAIALWKLVTYLYITIVLYFYVGKNVSQSPKNYWHVLTPGLSFFMWKTLDVSPSYFLNFKWACILSYNMFLYIFQFAPSSFIVIMTSVDAWAHASHTLSTYSEICKPSVDLFYNNFFSFFMKSIR